MTARDNRFFEEYKHLEKLCGEMFSCRSGVSEYISRMESSAADGRRLVDGWDADTKLLRHLRYVRNRLAHGDDADVSSPEDTRAAADFAARISSRRDPLAMLRAAMDAPPDGAPADGFGLGTSAQLILTAIILLASAAGVLCWFLK